MASSLPVENMSQDVEANDMAITFPLSKFFNDSSGEGSDLVWFKYLTNLCMIWLSSCFSLQRL